MYEEHVAPVDRDAGEFSSDDEVEIINCLICFGGVGA